MRARAAVVHSDSDVPEGFVRRAQFLRENTLDADDLRAFARGRKKGAISECKVIARWCAKRKSYATYVHAEEARAFIDAERARLAAIDAERAMLAAAIEADAERDLAVAAAIEPKEVPMNVVQSEIIGFAPDLREEVESLRGEVARLREIIGELFSLRKATEDMVAAVSLLAERGLTL